MMLFLTFATTMLAQANPFGNLNPPVAGMNSAIDPTTGQLTGLLDFLNNILRLVFIAAGLWVFVNLILAGFQYINAGGDSEAVATAWARIWQSILGLVIIVASFLVAAIIGIVMFGNPMAILNPSLGPVPTP